MVILSRNPRAKARKYFSFEKYLQFCKRIAQGNYSKFLQNCRIYNQQREKNENGLFLFFRANRLYLGIYIRPLCGAGIHPRPKRGGVFCQLNIN
jgi:hypothetical protein